MMGIKGKKKKGFHEMPHEFIWPHWMVTKMDLVANRFDYHRWMVNKWVSSPPLDSVITIKFSCHHWMESKKRGI